ncbi:hypothetical protein D9758_011422 [Tetrapyrgos nigripes]|uniref:Uncharacterized protein n=1 Tax=Tetrapyrgos nigripes TaxID=182062 RepID=A0A8H5CQB2_9AGAR|nr:hypothetical protein D9758_011422 [Tetrapyrgos nigripes]
MRPTPSSLASLSRLHSFIESGKHAAASRIRATLTHSGGIIPSDTIYIRPAVAGCHSSLSNVTVNSLYEWFHLLPAKHELRQLEESQVIGLPGLKGSDLDDTREPESDQPDEEDVPTWNHPADPFKHPQIVSLYTSGSPTHRLTIIFNVCKIAASKGYLSSVLPIFLHYTHRLTTPFSGTKMLLSLEEKALTYEQDLIKTSSHPSNATQDSKTSLKMMKARIRLRGIVIRACCGAGWIKEARYVLEKSEQGTSALKMPKEVHDFVRRTRKKSRRR